MTPLRHIQVVRALGGLGDVICAAPALRRLRAAHPTADITYIGLAQVRPIVARYSTLIDHFLPFPGFPGIVEQPFAPGALQRFLSEQAATPPADLAVQMHGSGSVSNCFTALLGAKRMAGWYVPGLWCPDADGFAPFPDSLSETDRWLALVERLGCPGSDDRPFFPITDGERTELAMLAPALGSGGYAVIHPGASDPRRRWPVDRFAAVAGRLARSGLRIVISGTAQEAPLAAALAQAMAEPALDLCGRTSLGMMGALVEGAQLVVTNDTGTSHLCAAFATPSVTIFIGSDPARWAPADGFRHLAVGAGIGDVPVGDAQLPRAATIPPLEAVLAATETLLEYA